MSEGKKAMVRSQEQAASTYNGYLLLLLGLVLLGWTVWSFLAFAGNTENGTFAAGWLAGWVGGLLASCSSCSASS